MIDYSLFESPCLPDPVAVSLEYLDYVQQYPQGMVSFRQARQHVLYHFEREESVLRSSIHWKICADHDFGSLDRQTAGRMSKMILVCEDIEQLEQLLRDCQRP